FVKKIYLSLFLILSLLPAASPAQKAQPAASPPAKPAQPVYEIPIVSKTLPNGMEVIVLPDHSVPLVTVELAVRNGSFTEPPELNGLSHLFEHMFFKPTKAIALYRCEKLQEARNVSAYRMYDCDNTLKLKSDIKDLNYLDTIDEDLPLSPNGTTQEEV